MMWVSPYRPSRSCERERGTRPGTLAPPALAVVAPGGRALPSLRPGPSAIDGNARRSDERRGQWPPTTVGSSALQGLLALPVLSQVERQHGGQYQHVVFALRDL